MPVKELVLRFSGIPMALLGLLMIAGSGEILVTDVIFELSDGVRGLLLRGGFAVMLLGLLMVFLFSFRTVPKEISSSFLEVQSRNLGRILDSMGIEGRGVYMPPRGRLSEDRVYVPVEKKDLPLPMLHDTTVLNIGTTGPSMGVSLVPPGKGLVDKVEEMTGTDFGKVPLMDGSEALEKLSKGTGLFGSLELRERGESLVLEIVHHRKDEVCEMVWKEYPDLHSRTGCPLCSAALCATARMAGVPLRIRSVKRVGKRTVYDLGRSVE